MGLHGGRTSRYHEQNPIDSRALPRPVTRSYPSGPPLRFSNHLCTSAALALACLSVPLLAVAAPLNDSSAVDHTRGPVSAMHDNLAEALDAAGMDERTFVEQSELAARLAEDSALWSREFPSAFAGVRVSGTTGQVGVVPDATGAVELRRRAHDRGYRVFDAPDSAHDLQSRARRVNDWTDSLPDRQRESVVGPQVDPASGEVRVVVTDAGGPTDAAASGADRVERSRFRRAQGSSGGSSRPATAAPSRTSDPGVSAPPDAMLGGERFLADDDTSKAANWCSLGFHGTLAGRVVTITAAHCSTYGFTHSFRPSTLRAELDGAALGRFTSELTDVKLDAAVVTIEPSAGPLFRHSRIHGAGGDPIDVTGVQSPVVGQTVCKFGQRSGYTCGTVSSLDGEVTQAGRNVMIDLCALSGDSGGSVFAGTRAVGVISLSNAFTPSGHPYDSCSEAADRLTAEGEKPQIIAVTLDSILARFPDLNVFTV